MATKGSFRFIRWARDPVGQSNLDLTFPALIEPNDAKTIFEDICVALRKLGFLSMFYLNFYHQESGAQPSLLEMWGWDGSTVAQYLLALAKAKAGAAPGTIMVYVTRQDPKMRIYTEGIKAAERVISVPGKANPSNWGVIQKVLFDAIREVSPEKTGNYTLRSVDSRELSPKKVQNFRPINTTLDAKSDNDFFTNILSFVDEAWLLVEQEQTEEGRLLEEQEEEQRKKKEQEEGAENARIEQEKTKLKGLIAQEQLRKMVQDYAVNDATDDVLSRVKTIIGPPPTVKDKAGAKWTKYNKDSKAMNEITLILSKLGDQVKSNVKHYADERIKRLIELQDEIEALPKGQNPKSQKSLSLNEAQELEAYRYKYGPLEGSVPEKVPSIQPHNTSSRAKPKSSRGPKTTVIRPDGTGTDTSFGYSDAGPPGNTYRTTSKSSTKPSSTKPSPHIQRTQKTMRDDGDTTSFGWSDAGGPSGYPTSKGPGTTSEPTKHTRADEAGSETSFGYSDDGPPAKKKAKHAKKGKAGKAVK